MNRPFSLLYYGVLCLMFGIAPCFHAQNAKGVMQPEKVTLKVDEKVKAVKDSLLKSGVDSIIIYSKLCNGCYTAPTIANRQQVKKGDVYSIKAYALPAYVFWKKNGNFYVKKIDQFGEYKQLQRWSYLQVPVYDFIEKNRDHLVNENYVRILKDSTKEYVSNNSMKMKFVERSINVEYYQSPEILVSPERPFTNGASIEYYSSSFTFKRSVSDDYFNPVATEQTEKELIDKFKKGHPLDSVIIGNSKSHYSLNRSMRIYILKQMMDSELLEIEMKGLWTPAK